MSAVEVSDTRSAVGVTVDGLTVVSPLVKLVLLGPLVTVMSYVVMPWLELSEEVLTAVVVASCVRAGLVVEEYFTAARVTMDGLSTCAIKVSVLQRLDQHPLTSLAEEPAFASARQVIPLSFMHKYGSDTVLTFKVIGLRPPPVAERRATAVRPPPTVFEEAYPHSLCAGRVLHCLVLFC